MLTKEQILNARNARMKKVRVESLGGDVIIRALSVSERDQQIEISEGLSMREKLLVYATFVIGDESGDRMFTDWKELDDALPEESVWEILDLGDEVNATKKAKSTTQPAE